MSEQSYLLVKLELDSKSSRDTDTSPHYITNNIIFSLKSVFGELGAATPFTVLRYSSDSKTLILSCPDTCLVKLRSALTLQSSYQGIDCCYSVIRVVKDLISLSSA